MKLCFWIATERNEKFMGELVNVSSTLVLPKQRDKSTKSTLPFYHWNIDKSSYLRHPGIKPWNIDFPENLKTLASYILFLSRHIDWKPTSNMLYFNSYIILKGMCKRNHSFLIFENIWDKIAKYRIIGHHVYPWRIWIELNWISLFSVSTNLHKNIAQIIWYV